MLVGSGTSTNKYVHSRHKSQVTDNRSMVAGPPISCVHLWPAAAAHSPSQLVGSPHL